MAARSRNLTLIALVVGLLAISASAQSQTLESVIGKWKLNPEKTKTDPVVLKSEMRVYEDWGGGLLHARFEGTDVQDKPTFREYVVRLDGRDYPVTRPGAPTAWTISWKAVDARNFEYAFKEGTKIVQSGTINVSADGKVMSIALQGASAVTGKPTSGTLVFDKQ
jgi:hypothetical protein